MADSSIVIKRRMPDTVKGKGEQCHLPSEIDRYILWLVLCAYLPSLPLDSSH